MKGLTLTLTALTIVSLLALTGSATAQNGGETTRFDVNTPTNGGHPGATGCLGHVGVAVNMANEIHVSARGSADPITGNYVPTPPHTVYVYDYAGTLLRSYAQDPAHTSSWGARDGATDHNWGSETYFFGSEAGIVLTDATGAATTTYLASGGIQTLPSNVITGPGLTALGNYRGVAYDPTGNGGTGSWWTANYASDLLEIDNTGTILTTHSGAAAGWVIFGLALDQQTNTLWCNSAPDMGALAEIDTTTGLLTGTVIPFNDGAFQGGLDALPGGIAGRAIGGTDLVGLSQADPDEVHAVILNLGSELNFSDQDALLIGTNGSTTATHVWADGTEASIDMLVTNTTGFTLGAVIIMNFGADATANALIPPVFPYAGYITTGFSLPALITTPAAYSFDFPATAGTPVSVAMGPIAANATNIGSRIGVQALAISTKIVDPGQIPVYPTNRALFELHVSTAPLRGVVVEARGVNSFNSDTSAGYFSVFNPSPTAITKVILTTVDNMIFDTGQAGMADQFNAGDGTGCAGTYRNGSAAATGLDFTVPGQAPLTACSNGTATGFKTDGNVSSTTIEFEFAGGTFHSGAKFEFDCDTDLGAGVAGGAMDGMLCIVEFVDGTIINNIR